MTLEVSGLRVSGFRVVKFLGVCCGFRLVDGTRNIHVMKAGDDTSCDDPTLQKMSVTN